MQIFVEDDAGVPAGNLSCPLPWPVPALVPGGRGPDGEGLGPSGRSRWGPAGWV